MACVREKLQKKESPGRQAAPALSCAAAASGKKCLVGNTKSGTTQPIRFPDTVIIEISWSEGFMVSRGLPHLQLPWILEVGKPARLFSQLKRQILEKS